MAWQTVGGSLKGPQGAQGPQGPQGPQGVAGADGKSVTIVDNVPTQANLPTGLGAADAGKGWITDDTGNLWVWSGTAFTNVGKIQGPAGPQGPQGATGPQGPQGAKGDTGATGATGAAGVRGTIWFTGTGAPSNTVPQAGQLPGDLYLDTASGLVYKLS